MTHTSSNSASALARTTGWITFGALLALAPQLVACEDNEAKTTSEVAATPTTPATALAPQPVDAANTYVNQVAKAEPQAEVKEVTPHINEKPAHSLERSQTAISAAEDHQPFVKRLVIASSVQEREPIELTEGKVREPVLAFVELQNLGQLESGVVVTFEHENGKKVGFVELSVPAESKRFRTWARTHNVQEPGTWTAVVKSKDGKELARKSFTVSS